MTTQEFKVGDLVLIEGEWTPEGKNAGKVVDTNAKNVYGTDDHLLVSFKGEGRYVYLKRSATLVKI